MKKLSIIIYLLYSYAGFSQTIELNITVKYIDFGEIEYSNIDTTYFETYWNCGMDKGIRLKENLNDGQYNVLHNDTLVYSANYENNKKHGLWTSYYSNGNISSTQIYSNGVSNGHYVKMNLQGDTTTIYQTVNGQLDGKWITKNSKGIITYCGIFENGEKIFTTEFSETGVKEKTTEYKDGLYHGKQIDFFENGIIQREIIYEMDKVVKYIYYDKNGEIVKETIVKK